jgi:hypothetical protein
MASALFFLSTSGLAKTLPAISGGDSLDDRAFAVRSLDDWDIPKLTDDVNRSSLGPRLRYTGHAV